MLKVIVKNRLIGLVKFVENGDVAGYGTAVCNFISKAY